MCLAKSHGMGQQQQQRAKLTGVVYANAAAQLMKMIYVSSAHQANNTADIDSASSLYHDYVSLHFYQVMEASTSCSFAAKVQETGNVSLLTEASKLQARDADFGKDLHFSGGMDGHLPSGSIIPSRAKNNGVSRFSRREKSDKIFQNPSTLKDINIQRPTFKETPARTSRKVQRSWQGNFIFEIKIVKTLKLSTCFRRIHEASSAPCRMQDYAPTPVACNSA